MTSRAEQFDSIHSIDDLAPPGGAPPTEGLPDFLTVVEAARLLRIGRTSAYQLAQQWQYSDGREGLPVVRVGHQLRVPRRALERLAGGELTPGPAPSSGSSPLPESPPARASWASSPRAPTDDNTKTSAAEGARDRAPTAKARSDARDARRTQPSLFPTDR